MRCDEDRIDVLKVLVTGPPGTPYAFGRVMVHQSGRGMRVVIEKSLTPLSAPSAVRLVPFTVQAASSLIYFFLPSSPRCPFLYI